MEHNYRDYFIKEGLHVGHYEDMYHNCKDPWRIEELGRRLDMQAALLLLEGREGKINDFLDVGAGLGLFTGFLIENIWKHNPRARGLVTDISETAITRAEQNLADPRLYFQTLDVRTLASEPRLSPQSFDLVVLAQVLWGLLEDLGGTLRALSELLRPEGMMLISQHFPGKENQSYGAEVVNTPLDLVKFLNEADLKPVATLETNRSTNHHWAALVKHNS